MRRAAPAVKADVDNEGHGSTVGAMREGVTRTERPPFTFPPDNSSPPAPPAPPPAPRRSWWSARWLLAGLLLAVVALFLANQLISRKPAISAKDVNGIVNQKVSSAITALQSQPPVAAQVYNQARAGLVLIEAQHPGGAGSEDLGTGIIVNTQGDILTALHVVDGASSIKVTFADGTASAASIKSSDPTHDVAVLSAKQLPGVIVPEVLGGSVQIGDPTFAVGNPLGLVGSLSAGVISGLNRSFPLSDGRTLTGMIQFDAAVNPGSSGGPLLNGKGQVIGIVTGLANAEGAKDFAGIGFAVSIATAGGAAGAPAR
jgi:S1-C subfamily serine protease